MGESTKQLQSIFIYWTLFVIVCTGLAVYIHNKNSISESEYLERLKELGYDTTNPNEAKENAKAKVLSIQKKLNEASNQGYNVGMNECMFKHGRRGNSCIRKYARKAEQKAENDLTQNDRDLVKYFSYYNIDEKKYASKAAITGFVIWICVPIFGALYTPNY